ncbi:protein ALP1-like [Phoenix dactylifera]|uniref:Protein ALP1-like n=1 Tax=Phoenix dactylifera TaxID=42345 RepID=A0A8B7BKZ2_PHODC|nr:protein ALP1-like [Phoenix dactylifera]
MNRIANLRLMIMESDQICIDQLRMDRRAFWKLCEMLKSISKLEGNRNVQVEEMVAIFLHTLGHHSKNRVMQLYFRRSGETVSRHFNVVLNAILRLHRHLLKNPEPVTERSTDEKWMWFPNCLGALDGTHIRVRVSEKDKPRYRSRKNEISTNVLGVYSQDMQFIYVLPGWEGSAHDNRVLRDAISRRNGLKVPQGYYYLCDAGYTNSEGFLTPFRGQRYHLNEWRHGHQPTTPEELYNMRHSKARNVIERCFGLLKMRWAILRSNTWYPIKTMCRIISVCCLLHNYIRKEMSVDPIEALYNEEECSHGNFSQEQGAYIEYIELSASWNAFRANLAAQMFEEWQHNRI